MLNKIILIILFASLVTSNVLLWKKISQKNTVAFVRSQIVLEKYNGMKEASAVFEKKSESWKTNYDSLEYSYNKAIQEYNAGSIKMSSKEKTALEKSIKAQEEVLSSYSKTLEAKSKEENEKLVQGVLNQVNEYIKTYAKKNEFDIVLGVTLNGNILYGADAIDITDKIIEGLNKEHSGK